MGALRRPKLIVLVQAFALVLSAAGFAAHADDSDDGRKPLKPKQGFLILPIESDERIPNLKFESAESASFTISGVRVGQQVVLVRAKPGIYRVGRVGLGGGYFIDGRSGKALLTAEVVADTITYSSDVVLDRRGISVSFRMGGCSIDILRLLVQLEPRIDATVFDRYPVLDRADSCKPLDPADGSRSRTAEGWAAAAQTPGSDHELAMLAKFLAKVGGKPLAKGQSAQSAWEALEGLPTDKVERFRDSDEATTAIWIRPAGRWGWKGMRAIYHLLLPGGTLTGVALREFETNGMFEPPSAELRHDLETDIDAVKFSR